MASLKFFSIIFRMYLCSGLFFPHCLFFVSEECLGLVFWLQRKIVLVTQDFKFKNFAEYHLNLHDNVFTPWNAFNNEPWKYLWRWFWRWPKVLMLTRWGGGVIGGIGVAPGPPWLPIGNLSIPPSGHPRNRSTYWTSVSPYCNHHHHHTAKPVG